MCSKVLSLLWAWAGSYQIYHQASCWGYTQGMQAHLSLRNSTRWWVYRLSLDCTEHLAEVRWPSVFSHSVSATGGPDVKFVMAFGPHWPLFRSCPAWLVAFCPQLGRTATASAVTEPLVLEAARIWAKCVCCQRAAALHQIHHVRGHRWAQQVSQSTAL